MKDELKTQALSIFKLTTKQREAALARGRDIVVTAGAGSGKTNTLVARYVTLLTEGYPVRRIAAITFTEKAAREMRSRVKQTLSALEKQAGGEDASQFWAARNAEMDAARIGTIHSLCSEILRAHPAEAGIDPKFNVIDEGNAAALRVQIVEDTLAKMVGKSDFELLFRLLEIKDLAALLSELLAKRLEAEGAFQRNIDGRKVLYQKVVSILQDSPVADCIAELRGFGNEELLDDAGDKLFEQVQSLLEMWNNAEELLGEDGLTACAIQLHQARRTAMSRNPGKKTSRAKTIVADLQIAYDDFLDPICGGKNASDYSLDADVETDFFQSLGLIQDAFEEMHLAYKQALRQTGSLDFDDLEDGAAKLLQKPDICGLWQAEIKALLVDEFQDTNQRQRAIVEALAGGEGKLFVVGDAKQSIYRFRQADVTVFQSIKERIEHQAGIAIDIDETFRTHEPLLAAVGDLLAHVMIFDEDPAPDYFIPYQPMSAYHKAPRVGMKAPHLEFVYGAGENTAEARSVAASALAAHLLELKNEEQIQTWDDVALLFRASTGFSYYEDAMENAGIPFVTVAGRGFYDRAEIRDVLNILRALSDPTDDLAMAGLMRSPAFGLSDAALYQLRWQAETASHYWEAIQGDLSCLDEVDQQRAKRLVTILADLIPRVDRIPTADLLKKLIDATDYRAILAIGDSRGSEGRLWRNLDKLVEDAQASERVNVREFLDYLKAINDAGAREGEAPAEAQGAVRLMTIHKSKGLEFPVVVLADASRDIRGKSSMAFLLPETGLAYKLDPPPMLYKWAKHLEQKQADAEDQRILYVALTRARDKVIINGHITPSTKRDWKASAWLNDLGSALSVDLNFLMQEATDIILQTTSGQSVRAWAANSEIIFTDKAERVEHTPVEEPDEVPIFDSLLESASKAFVDDEPKEIKDWFVTGAVADIPLTVVGKLIHKALELWLFPDNPHFIPMLEATARTAGLAHTSQILEVVKHCEILMRRFQIHPLRMEIQEAEERHHEVPYSRMVGDHTETGYIDLLYRTPAGWQIIDFKTDTIRSAAHRNDLIRDYFPQLRRYESVFIELLDQSVKSRICFLDDQGKLELVTV